MAETRSLEQTPEGWDAVTEMYEEAAETFSVGYAEQLLDLAEVEDGVRLLDVACGPGTVALEAARRGASVKAVDFSPRMVERCVERAEEEGLDLRGGVMDAQALDLDDDLFDVATSNFGIIFFPRRDEGLAELNRVVRPGGRVAVSVWSTPDRLGFLQLIGGAIQRALPDLPERPPPDWFAVATPEGLRTVMEDAGLEDVEIHTVTEEWTIPSADWLRSRVQGISPASRMLFDRLPEEGREHVLDALGDVLREKFGDGEARIPNEAHLGIARTAG